MFLPTEVDDRHLAVIAPDQLSSGYAQELGLQMLDANDRRNQTSDEMFEKQQRETAEKYKNLDKKVIEAIVAERGQRSVEQREETKQAFLRSIAARPSTLLSWQLETVVGNSRLANAASNYSPKMMQVNVSDSNFDDILVLDRNSNKVQLVSKVSDENDNSKGASNWGKALVTSLDVEGGLQAVLPMRLNLDALSDMVVLRNGSSVPSIVMSAPASTFNVTSTDENGDCQDPNPCSLRNAILLSNSSLGMDAIVFNLGAGVHTIALTTELPVITNAVSFQGSSDANNNKLVEISGANIASQSADGIKLRSSNSFIYNLNVNQFPAIHNPNGSVTGGNGLTIETTSNSPTSTNNYLLNNYLGTDPTGSFAKANQASGLNIFDSDGNNIDGNVMSGNDWVQNASVGISMTAGNSNNFWRNIIGLNALGTAKLPNVTGLFFAGADNNFGGEFPNDGNTVSGNGTPNAGFPGHCGGYGMLLPNLVDLTTNQLIGLRNNIKGNRFGTDPDGVLPMGNCYAAIITSPLTQTTIGAITESGRNTVSDNGFNAIACSEETIEQSQGGYCAIAGNNIGTDITGNFAMPNNDRNYAGGFDRTRGTVDILHNLTYSYFGAPGGTTPDGACTGLCNLYSGNNPGVEEDIYFAGYGTIGFFNNHIGTNQQGTQAISNTSGIQIGRVLYGRAFVGAVGTGDNSEPISLGNVISGNSNGALNAFTDPYAVGPIGYFSTLTIQGNRIGTDVTGTFAIPNGNPGYAAYGIYLSRGFTEPILVGGTHPLARNIISGNLGEGIISRSIYVLTGYGTPTKISNNLIGLSSSLGPLGNGGNGINVQDGFGVQIGGTDQDANQIAYNGTQVSNAAGVLVTGFGTSGIAYGISIRNNSIHDNAGLGIDLNINFSFSNQGGDGVTPNDCLDSDFGPNLLQNYPSLFAPTANGGGTTVTGYLRSSAAEEYQLDFYSNQTPDASGYGEGATYIGSKQVRTSGNGFVSFSFDAIGSPQNITATATDSFGNTSEFSCIAGQCSDPVRNIEEAEQILSTSICADPIVVNETGDESDDDLNDGDCDTDVNMPGLQCTLRAAMEESEHQPGSNAITFNIPGAGPFLIQPGSALPQMNQPVSIDASTQPGYAGTPLVAVSGIDTSNAYGFRLAGGNSLVRGFSVIEFKEQIGLSNSSSLGNNRVTGNYVGIWPNGAPGTKARQEFGIALVSATTNNRIGGTSPEDRNIVSGNQVGISIDSGSTNNQVSGNYIGTGPQGVAPQPNDFGISILNSNSNNIGTSIDSGSNLISGNLVSGIELAGTSSNNKVTGNLIGTDVNGSAPLGNKRGVDIIDGANNNHIGGASESERNVISGQNADNNSVGVLIGPDAGDSNQVSGNYVGVSMDGSAAVQNRVGIAVNADNQIVGSTNSGDFKNLIVSENTDGGYGIYLHPVFPNDELYNVTVQNNLVGSVSYNDQPLGYIGIYLLGNVKSAKISDNIVGYQSFSGIRLEDGPHNNTISNDLVGINSEGYAIPNFNGVVIKQSDTNFVKNNVVSGNSEHGIVVGDGFGQNDRPGHPAEAIPTGTSSFAMQNVITGNMVGTNLSGDDLVPNGAVGIGIAANARDNTVGGPGGDANIVGGSVGDFGIGIFVGIIDDAQPPDVFPQNNKVIGNRVGIGSEESGSNIIPNGYGIYVRNALGTIVGGDVATKGNIVCNSEADGIRLFKPGTTETTIQHNYVGVIPNGTTYGNGGDGISIDEASPTAILENTVGGNGGNGIAMQNISLLPAAKGGVRRPTGFLSRISGNLVGIIKDANGQSIAAA